MTTLDLDSVFDASEVDDTSTNRTTRHRVHRRSAGTLRLPSGRIVAADPFLRRSAFTQPVAPGAYPVELLVASSPMPNGDLEELHWFARVVFRREAPASWALATIEGEDVSSLGRGQGFGYGVDSGTGCFADGDLFARLAGDDAVEADLNRQLSEANLPAIIRHGDAVADLVGFTSGGGDGTYWSWFGLDGTGAPVCLVTSFGYGDFPRPEANPDPSGVATDVAARIRSFIQDARTAAVPDPDDDIDGPWAERGRALRGFEEITDHVAALLAAVSELGRAAPRALVTLARTAGFREAGQPQLAEWLALASADHVDLLVRAGAHQRGRVHLTPPLAAALLELLADGRVPVATLVVCLDDIAAGTEGPLIPIMHAGLRDDAADTRRRALHALMLAARRASLPADVVQRVIETVDDRDPAVQSAAAFALVAAVSNRRQLARFLDHASPVVRVKVALHLADDPPWFTGRTIMKVLRQDAVAPGVSRLDRRRAVALVADPALERQLEVLEAREAAANRAAWKAGRTRS